MARPRTYRRVQQKSFLAAFERVGTVCGAALVANVNRQQHYKWMREDETYPARFQKAIEAVVQSLEEQALKRARDGWLEDVYHDGKVVGQRRRFSTAMTIFMLKCWYPEKYRDSNPSFVLNQTMAADKLAFIETVQSTTLAKTAEILAACNLLPSAEPLPGHGGSDFDDGDDDYGDDESEDAGPISVRLSSNGETKPE
jgi:hypothetical protein